MSSRGLQASHLSRRSSVQAVCLSAFQVDGYAVERQCRDQRDQFSSVSGQMTTCAVHLPPFSSTLQLVRPDLVKFTEILFQFFGDESVYEMITVTLGGGSTKRWSGTAPSAALLCPGAPTHPSPPVLRHAVVTCSPDLLLDHDLSASDRRSSV